MKTYKNHLNESYIHLTLDNSVPHPLHFIANNEDKLPRGLRAEIANEYIKHESTVSLLGAILDDALAVMGDNLALFAGPEYEEDGFVWWKAKSGAMFGVYEHELVVRYIPAKKEQTYPHGVLVNQTSTKRG